MNTVPSVQPLKRLKLGLRAGPTAEGLPNAPPTLELGFIFGIGTAGLTPFECLLNHRLAGDEIEVRVPGPEAAVFFGHLAPLVGSPGVDGDEVHFSVRILAVEAPAPREVIKAMAEMASHGHGTGCDCGCGCG